MGLGLYEGQDGSLVLIKKKKKKSFPEFPASADLGVLAIG